MTNPTSVPVDSQLYFSTPPGASIRTLGAECSLVGDLRRQGGGRLVAVATVDGDGNPLAPCGRCRQILLEHGGPELLFDLGDGPVDLATLLPGAFDQATLEERTE